MVRLVPILLSEQSISASSGSINDYIFGPENPRLTFQFGNAYILGRPTLIEIQSEKCREG